MVFCLLPLDFSSCFQTQPQSPALFLHLAPLTALASISGLELLALTKFVCPSIPGSPLWSKEKMKAIVVQEGVSLVLPCRPPAGLPPPIIFWMDNCEHAW